MDNRVQELVELVVDGSPFGGIEGEPGWMLERRDVTDESNHTASHDWPAGARFKASVDEDAYRLQQPEYFILAIDAYVAAAPSRAEAPAVVALRKAIA